jgi:hypothetical protein
MSDHLAGIHATHSIVVIPHVQVAECSKCLSCVCHENKTLTKPCTNKAVEAKP